MIRTLDACALRIPFKAAFTHASASRDAMQSLWVQASLADGSQGYGEGCPREYVTGETLQGALDFVASVRADLADGVRNLASLERWAVGNKKSIDANPAAWCAVELALLDAFARSGGDSVESLLGLPDVSGSFRYSAVIGDGSARRFEAELDRYLQAGFRAFKIKLSGDRQRDLDKVSALKSARIAPTSVRADANNLWSDADDAAAFLAELDYGFWAVEEPLKAGDLAGMERLAAKAGSAIILDESLLRSDQLMRFTKTPAQWITNLRVSKMGGLLRSLQLLRRMRDMGLRVIVGAHVGETSLLTRAALTVASAAGESLVAQEGAFGTHLLEHDVVDPPLMFGAGGILKSGDVPEGPGFGLDPSDRPHAPSSRRDM